MSIYSTWLSIGDDDHEDGCAFYVEESPGIFEISGEPCDCGLPRAPFIYQGSHVLPGVGDPRGGDVDVAAIPDHVTRDGRDDAPEGALKDWLRLSVHEHEDTPDRSVGDATVVLDRPQVERLRDTLVRWLEREAVDA